jgi:hypothetical protein
MVNFQLPRLGLGEEPQLRNITYVAVLGYNWMHDTLDDWLVNARSTT